MNVYTDDKKHKSDTFRTRKDRDEIVKELRKDGWNVKVGKDNNFNGPRAYYWYEAVK